MQTFAGEDEGGAERLRECIIARPGHVLVVADFSQVGLGQPLKVLVKHAAQLLQGSYACCAGT